MRFQFNDRPYISVLAALGLAALGTSCTAPDVLEAGTSRTRSDQCFLPSHINGFSVVDRDTVDVRVGANAVYRLEVGNACLEIGRALQIGVLPAPGNTYVCEAMDADLIVPSDTGEQRCPVLSVHKLTEEDSHQTDGFGERKR